MAGIVLSKFDVAERQLLQAITLFFREEDPVSIHTLAEAAVQVLVDIGEEHGVANAKLLRNSDRIREDKKAEWFRALTKSRNFFKHADRDKNAIHEFNPDLNVFSILDAVIMHEAIKGWVPETLMFLGWFSLAYPHFLKEDSDLLAIFKSARLRGMLPEPTDKQLIYEVIKGVREGKFTLNNTILEYGLPLN